jgi:hypothetical protein
VDRDAPRRSGGIVRGRRRCSKILEGAAMVMSIGESDLS